MMFNETLSDAGNARWFVRLYRESVRFVRERNSWLVHLGPSWSESTDGAIERLAKDAAASIFANLDDCPKGIRDERIKHGLKTEQAPRLMAMLELAKSEPGITVPLSALDRDPFLLGTRGGGIDLRAGSFKFPAANEYVTRQVGCEYRRGAQCPTWLAFLDRAMAGDAAMIEFLQRAVGYSLTGDTSEQCIFICHGPGANGKSVFLRTVRALLGTYGADASIETFTDRRDGSASNDLARLANIRFVSATELDEGRRLAEGLIKSLTGGEALTARFLFREYFEFTPTFKVWLGVNHKPAIRGDDHGIWRRIRLVPFRVTIPPVEQDKTLAGRLLRELPGILNWATQGCVAWQRDGLQAPNAVVSATNAYREESDALGEWISERCNLGHGISTQAKFLYDDYRSFIEDRGGEILSMKRWGQRMVGKGLEKDEGRLVHYHGIGLCGLNGRNDNAASFIGERDLREFRGGFSEPCPYTHTHNEL